MYCTVKKHFYTLVYYFIWFQLNWLFTTMFRSVNFSWVLHRTVNRFLSRSALGVNMLWLLLCSWKCAVILTKTCAAKHSGKHPRFKMSRLIEPVWFSLLTQPVWWQSQWLQPCYLPPAQGSLENILMSLRKQERVKMCENQNTAVLKVGVLWVSDEVISCKIECFLK